MAERKKNIPKKRRKKRRIKKGVFFFVFTLFVVLVSLSLTVFFPIGKIQVEGKSIYIETEIVHATDIKEGDNLFMPLFNGSRGKAKAALPYLQSVSYRFVLPDTIVISVKPYIAAYQFKVNEEYVVVAKDGTALEILSVRREGVPVILVNGLEYQIREKVKIADTGRAESLAVIQSATEEIKESVDTIDLSDALNIKMQIAQTEVILGSNVYLEKKMQMVKKMLSQVPEGEKGTINMSAWTPENKQGSYIKITEE
ncbi:MAG: FtsQ-type POTRA domain-containing protein [Clostridia bacterium]|nr:FtsQ-type POTRA domain-containing protein [Clostridia bacterium]